MCKPSLPLMCKPLTGMRVCDTLNIHQSESLVRWVAQISGIEKDLG